ncbi:iron chelate uptake ABC transporter family permease subunit [Alkalibacterium iburiense]|uniref:iron chelate uptake ABC transporter family permease subunit n=1 Tax=Alkalibacterium iburiense TaxID=290589 RepID=UPI0031E2A956
MRSKENKSKQIIVLFIAVILSLCLCLTINTRGNIAFAFMLRSRRTLAFLLVGITTTVATIVFQTMTQNNILTPNIIGLDSLYVLLQTVIIFLFGTQHILTTNPYLNFFLSLLLMIGSSIIFYWLFFKKYPGRINLLLMLGLIAGTFFGSVTTFLQVIIDPNEFESVFSRTIASFTQVNTSLLIVSILTCGPIILYLFLQTSKLDVLHLGRSYSIGLGIDIDRYYLTLFILITQVLQLKNSL